MKNIVLFAIPPLAGALAGLCIAFIAVKIIFRLTGKIKKNILKEAEKQYPAAADSCIEFLRQKEMRQKLEKAGLQFLTDVIQKLNIFQRLFISAARFDVTLSQQMPGIIDNLIDKTQNLLAQDLIRQKAMDALESLITRYQGRLKIIAKWVCIFGVVVGFICTVVSMGIFYGLQGL